MSTLAVRPSWPTLLFQRLRLSDRLAQSRENTLVCPSVFGQEFGQPHLHPPPGHRTRRRTGSQSILRYLPSPILPTIQSYQTRHANREDLPRRITIATGGAAEARRARRLW